MKDTSSLVLMVCVLMHPGPVMEHPTVQMVLTRLRLYVVGIKLPCNGFM